MLASVFQSAGYNTGLYTSPHLKDFRERIRINGQMIPEKEVVQFIDENQSFLEQNKLSFFEMSVGMAFDYFANQKVDIAIIETGMGGRLDSTNIITPELSIITNIGLDHTTFLGESLSEIAGEKAGIIKERVPIVIGEKHIETEVVFTNTAEKTNSNLLFAEDFEFQKYDTDLKGNYQKKNLRTVLVSIKELRKNNWFIPEEAIISGLSNVKLYTGFQGRWDIIGEKPRVICDTAHNSEGLSIVLKQLKMEKFLNLHIVLGVVSDKDLSKVLPLFPEEAVYYFVKPDVPRGLEVKLLQNEAAKFGLKGKSYLSVREAFLAAERNALDEDLIFIGGSNFTVAEVL